MDIELQAASEHTVSSGEHATRRHGNRAPVGGSLSVVLTASLSREGREQRGRDAGAVRAADKGSRLY